jgi:SAM-dependent methyltransferase
MESDRRRWDQRWADNGPSAVEITARPPDVIDDHPRLLDRLPSRGPALDVACGVGAQSLWMAGRGLDVTALDVSPVAVDLLRAAADQQGLSVDARVHDTDAGLPDDLIELAVIVCQRYRAARLYEEFVERLRPGGVLVLTVLSAVGLDGEPGEFHAQAGELTAAFEPLDVDVLVDVEADGQASIVVSRRDRG